jgi:cytochrome P450
VTDAAVISGVLRQRPDTFRRGPRLEQVSRELGFHGLFSSNGEDWRRQRPMVLAGLDPSHIRSFMPAMVEVTGRLRDKWTRAAADGASIDLLADLMRYTVDVTTGLAFGSNLNTLEQSDDAAIQKHLNVIFPTLAKRVLAPVDFQHWLPDRETMRHVQALREAVSDFITKARAQLTAHPALREAPQNLIQALIAGRDREGSGLTDEDVSGNVLTMLLAGEDTTANTLAWMVWLLFNNPPALESARREVDGLLPSHGLVSSMEELSKLDEVEACAHEAMRLKPVAPLNIVEAAHDVVVGDVLVPKGAFVVCLMRPPGLDAAAFPDPSAFSPARWRSAKDGSVTALSSAKRVAMPFGAGPRICPGRYLAIAEIKMVAAMLLSGFDLTEVAAPDGEPRERLALTMSPVGLRMRLRLR